MTKYLKIPVAFVIFNCPRKACLSDILFSFSVGDVMFSLLYKHLLQTDYFLKFLSMNVEAKNKP